MKCTRRSKETSNCSWSIDLHFVFGPLGVGPRQNHIGLVSVGRSLGLSARLSLSHQGACCTDWSWGRNYSCLSYEHSCLIFALDRLFPFCPVKGFYLFLGSCSWSDVRSKVREVVCVRIVNHSEANLWFRAIWNKLNWIDTTEVFLTSGEFNFKC